MPLDSLSIFSVVSKFMGQYPEDWEKHLESIGARGYNMVHFTPLMERGDSNSPYSIYDQLKFDSTCFPKGETDIAALMTKMEREHGLLGLTDVVFNHTANNSKWLEEHPEAGYSVDTAPWLQAALEVDDALLNFGNKLESYGLPAFIRTPEDLRLIMSAVEEHVIQKLNLWQYYVVNVERDGNAAIKIWATGNYSMTESKMKDHHEKYPENVKEWSLKQKADYLLEKGLIGSSELGPRYHRRVDPYVAGALLSLILGPFNPSNPGLEELTKMMISILDVLNKYFYQEYQSDAATIIRQVSDRVKYLRMDDHGPKLGAIGPNSRFVESYFTRLPSNTTTQKHKQTSLALVNNGWIWAADAMKDHAGSDSRAYLRREVIVWSDCVKLRYGKSTSDNPFLWEYMAQYTRLMAKYFVGFRIDNCHSTPIHVAEYLLDQAREVRPNLAVYAELFSGSEQTDLVFVQRLGLSALIREAMQAWSTGEMSRLVHMHGGRPIGSFEVDEVYQSEKSRDSGKDLSRRNDLSSVPKERIHRIKRSPVHALFMDCTHDNEFPAQKRDARDTLPNAALVNMCDCASGSVMGYDEIYPRHVNIVNETRLYSSSSTSGTRKDNRKNELNGIGGIKKRLNEIHTLMGKDGYDETFIHHEGQYVTVHRVHPKSRKGYFAIAHSAYPGSEDNAEDLRPVHLAGTKANLIGSWMLEVDTDDAKKSLVLADPEFLKGLPSLVSDLYNIRLDNNDNETVISVPERFPPGSIALFETWIPGAEHSEGLDRYVTNDVSEAFADLNLFDLNLVLYRCEPEERDLSDGRDGVYNIPEHGPLVYAGLQGWWSVLRNVIRNNDLGHPICNHLRNGQWALDYISERLERLSRREGHRSLHKSAEWFRNRFSTIRKVPNFLLPRYFALVIQAAYHACWDRCMKLMSDDVQQGQMFLQRLAIVSVQLTSYVKSASLYPSKSVPSMAAGLPHFTRDWSRCWGRDVFISLRGLYLVTGRYQIAKEHILAFASVLKHGMIPNLLSDGKNPRYNSRDSIWFFLQSIQDYTKIVPDGEAILRVKVARRFLSYDDTYFDLDDPRAYSQSSSIAEIIQEAIQRHFMGLSFREANAGPRLDMQMKTEGFQIDIRVDRDTGFVFGGNQFNCGTWMDKMGESEKAGSKGIPGTPRDGAAVEITGLLYSTLTWLNHLNQEGHYEHTGVEEKDGKIVSFSDWATRIRRNFERCYYIPLSPEDDSDYDINPHIVNRRGIYKDLYKSGKEYEDYQLRPNFPIAMTVAPDLFTPSKALEALQIADSILSGPTGIATLDPSDLNYRPRYDNSEDSADFATAKGRNYHQGPEWLWPRGFFLRALLKFDLMRRTNEEGRTEAFQQVTKRLKGCRRAIEESPWAGLTELTNGKGGFCKDSVSHLWSYLSNKAFKKGVSC